MKKNMGAKDATIRWIVGIILLLLLFIGKHGQLVRPHGIHWVLGVIGLILVLTALFRFCPLYTIFKINTNKK